MATDPTGSNNPGWTQTKSVTVTLAGRSLAAFEDPIGDGERYVVLGEIAHGGGGRILRALDQRLGRDVALKVPLDPEGETRLVQEAAVTARLEHPAIVAVHDAGRLRDGRAFFAMKLVAGRSLRDVVTATQSIAERLALLPSIAAVADALAYAHAQGVIHRDVKPHNVLVGAFGETALIDWGLAKFTGGELTGTSPALSSSSEITQAGTVLGTPAFMPPEQARGEPADMRADVFGLGALLYFVLAGRPPLSDDSPSTPLGQRVPRPLDAKALGVPPELCAIAAKAMAHDPAARYPGALEFAADLRRFQEGLIVSAHRYSLGAILRRFIARNRAWLSVATTALVVFGVLGALAVQRTVHDRAREASERAAAETLAQFALDDLRERLLAIARIDVMRSFAQALCRYYEELQRTGPLGAAENTRWARALVHLGESQIDAELQDTALASLEQARRLFHQAAVESPAALDPRAGEAEADTYIADAKNNLGRARDALHDAEHAVATLEPLVARPAPPFAWRKSLVFARLENGRALRFLDRLDEAHAAILAAQALAADLLRESPDSVSARSMMVLSHIYLANVAALEHDSETMLRSARSCREGARPLLEADPGALRWLRYLSGCSYHEAIAGWELRQFAQALRAARDDVEIGHSILRRDPANDLSLQDQVTALVNQVAIATASGDWAAARAALEQAGPLGDRLLAKDQRHGLRTATVLRISVRRGELELAMRRWQAALDAGRAGGDQAERALAAFPGASVIAMHRTSFQLIQARALLGLGRSSDAIALARAALASSDQLMRELPGSTERQDMLADAATALGDALATSAPGLAHDQLMRALAIRDSLLARRQPADWRIARALVLRRLAALESGDPARAHLGEAIAVLTEYQDGRLTPVERAELDDARAALHRAGWDRRP
jgi:hypothetical protein